MTDNTSQTQANDYVETFCDVETFCQNVSTDTCDDWVETTLGEVVEIKNEKFDIG